MSFFKTGFDDYENELLKQEQEHRESQNKPFVFRLAVNETKEIIMLDDTGFRYYEHAFYNQITRKSLAFTCKDGLGGEECLICKAGIKPSPILVATVKDMSGYMDNVGQRKGIGNRLLLKIKRTAAKRLYNKRVEEVEKRARSLWEKQESACRAKGCNSVEDVAKEFLKKGNILKYAKIRASRYGEKAENCGDEFSIVDYVRPEFFKPDDVPFNYEKEFAPVSNQQIIYDLKGFFGNDVPPNLSVILGSVPAGNSTNSLAGTNNNQMFEAPPVSVDELPF
jgi:hypothetical protein